jgi:hypothetical protein
MDLEEVFLHFLNRFESLPTPRSVAEARITTDESEALKLWFSGQEPRMWCRVWCESTSQVCLSEGSFASKREMFGVLLLILASEVCRASSNEDSVWPAVTAVLHADKVSFSSLFVGGQPTTACKNAVAAGARRLKLRNLIDRYGAQEYFDTLKLQFGFTRQGAVRRSPEWLDGLGLPIAVRILAGVEPEYGDLKSSSFNELWNTLHDFRHGRVSDGYMSAVLQASPWIRTEWASELMRAAKLRTNRASTASCAPEILDHTNEPVCELLLRWQYPAKPELSLRLNDERVCEILGESDTATFAIDGCVVDRWTLQESGNWRGRRELPCQPQGAKPNLRPNLLSVSSEGEVLEEVDLFEMGMGEPLLIFDLESRTAVSLTSKLNPRKDYALICDTDLSVPGVTQAIKLKDRAAYRLASPWHQDLRVECDGLIYWEPKLDDKEPIQPIHLTLESLPSETVQIGSAYRVKVTGVPEDAKVVSLIAGGSRYPTSQNGTVWQTERPLLITLGMALGKERIRVRVSTVRSDRTVTPKLSLNFRGIACLEADSNPDAEPNWTLVHPSRPLNRADDSGGARVFVGRDKSELFEGPCFVGKISSRTFHLGDLYGWGAPLIIRSERHLDSVLVESVEDHGRGKFLPSLFRGRTEPCLAWQVPMSPSNDHRILVWREIFQEPRKLPENEVSTQRDDFIWRLPNLGVAAAMAIAYQGFRIASYWDADRIIHGLKHVRSRNLFALLRWLKVPVLNSSFMTAMQEAVDRDPAEFVNGWVDNAALQYGLVHRQPEQGLDVVIRQFLWNYVERNEARMEKVAQAFSEEPRRQTESEVFKSSLSRLGEICPSLSYSLARIKLRGDKYRKCVRAVAASMLRQPETTETSQLRARRIADCRECANLLKVTPEALEKSVNAFGAYLDDQASDYKQLEPDLRRLGEKSRGPQFITASLLIRLLERNRF